jgi:hypothetical protein
MGPVSSCSVTVSHGPLSILYRDHALHNCLYFALPLGFTETG